MKRTLDIGGHWRRRSEGMQSVARGSETNIRNGPRYPHVKVHMTRADSGFCSTVVAVQTAMRRAGVPMYELSNFYEDAAYADGDNLLRTCLRWVDVDV